MARFGRRRPPMGVIQKITPIDPANTAAPSPPPILGFRVAVQTAYRRYQLSKTRHRLLENGASPIIPVVQVITAKIKIDHSEKIIDPQSRRHEQQVARLINQLAKHGGLTGTIDDPFIGYQAGDVLNWSNNPPTTVWDALDRMIAMIDAGGAASGPAGGVLSGTYPNPLFRVTNESADANCFPTFFTDATGGGNLKTNLTYTFNSATGALGVVSIELGDADTTIARVSAGVVSIEGFNILTTATGAPAQPSLNVVKFERFH